MRKPFALILLVAALLSPGANALALSWSDLCPWIWSRSKVGNALSLSEKSNAELEKMAKTICNPLMEFKGSGIICDAALTEIKQRQAEGNWSEGWKPAWRYW